MSILPLLERVPNILSGEPSAGDISQNKERRDEFAADSCAAEEKTDKRAQSTNRRQQQHDAVIARTGRGNGRFRHVGNGIRFQITGGSSAG